MTESIRVSNWQRAKIMTLDLAAMGEAFNNLKVKEDKPFKLLGRACSLVMAYFKQDLLHHIQYTEKRMISIILI